MSTAAVSTATQASLYSQLQQYFHTRQSDLQQLGKDLNTGDTTDAATEYQDIVQLGQSGPFASGNAFSRTDRESDFTAIGTALQSGDLAGAQQAFSSLKATFEKAVPVQNPAPQGPAPIVSPILSSTGQSSSTGSNSGPEIVLNIGASSSSTPEQITINISNPASGGEQVSIGIGSEGSTSQQVTTLNLPANSNEQIVLNLLGASGASSSTANASASTASSLSVTA
ncbi:MAG: hypothetical protein ACLQLC_17875 [Candidatus Sulfotelmatobacter sp.]